MNKLRVIIIDDEQNSRDFLKTVCKDYLPDVEVVAVAASLEEGVKSILSLRPDLLLLDINLSGRTGFEVLESLPDELSDMKTIFITAYPEHAIKAFKYNAYDYLLKPVKIQELRKAIDRLKKQKQQVKSSKKEQLVIPITDGYSFVQTDDIIRLEGQGNYTNIVLIDGTSLMVSKLLKYFEDRLDSQQFYRIHQSFLINLNHVHQFSRINGGRVKMIDGTWISIARSKKNQFIELIKKGL